MPYIFGEWMPGWDEYWEQKDGRSGEEPPPASLYEYDLPWETKAAMRLSPGEIDEAFCANLLWNLSRLAAQCRDLGVKRVFGSYDHESDERLTHFTGIEMRDSRVITAGKLGRKLKGAGKTLVDVAVTALMGDYYREDGFELYGVVTIDVDACTVTDEKNADVVFGKKMPWEV